MLKWKEVGNIKFPLLYMDLDSDCITYFNKDINTGNKLIELNLKKINLNFIGLKYDYLKSHSLHLKTHRIAQFIPCTV